MIAFSIISALIILSMGIMMYWRFSDISEENIIENNQKLMEQTAESVENYLINMRQISDAAYYYVIKENDLSGNIDEIHKGMNLLYEANKDKLRSIAVYNKYGSLMAAEPVATQKEEPRKRGNTCIHRWIYHTGSRCDTYKYRVLRIQILSAFPEAFFCKE